MNIHHLIKMANEIGAFFESEPDRAIAMEGVASHIKRFWDPRMRRELLLWVDEHGGEGLKELVADCDTRESRQARPENSIGHEIDRFARTRKKGELIARPFSWSQRSG